MNSRLQTVDFVLLFANFCLDLLLQIQQGKLWKRGKNFRVKTRLVFQPPFGKISAMENEPSEKSLKPNCLGKKYTSKFIKFSPNLGVIRQVGVKPGNSCHIARIET